MGAGKTSVGRALAHRLGWEFEDLDDRIVAREGRTIPEIFRNDGESAFRRAEHESLRRLLEELAAGSGRIVALGGGAFAQARNAATLKRAGFPTVLLDAPAEDLWQRCHQQAASTGVERPLLKSRDEFQRLYRARRRAYTKASFRIETSGRTAEQVAAEIARTLGLKERIIPS
jgi:shikimate kinase